MSNALIISAAVAFAITMGFAIFRVSIWLTDRKSNEQLAKEFDKIDHTRNSNDGFMF